jgi:hypothetical protein
MSAVWAGLFHTSRGILPMGLGVAVWTLSWEPRRRPPRGPKGALQDPLAGLPRGPQGALIPPTGVGLVWARYERGMSAVWADGHSGLARRAARQPTANYWSQLITPNGASPELPSYTFALENYCIFGVCLLPREVETAPNGYPVPHQFHMRNLTKQQNTLWLVWAGSSKHLTHEGFKWGAFGGQWPKSKYCKMQ